MRNFTNWSRIVCRLRNRVNISRIDGTIFDLAYRICQERLRRPCRVFAFSILLNGNFKNLTKDSHDHARARNARHVASRE